MTRGKSICNVLKTIRKQIADANEIKYEPRECHHQGECRGTCPACEAEVRYIERQLDIRRQLGRAVAIVGISAGLSALSGCGDKSKKVDNVSEEESDLTVGKVMVEPAERLDGDVEYMSPVDTVIIEKDPKTIKKRTAPFKAPEKNNDKANGLPQEKSEGEQNFEVLGIVDATPEPLPPTDDEVPANRPDYSNFMGDVVEQMPSFPGGTQALVNYLSENIKYPEGSEGVCVQGRVIITFVVEKDGSITEAKVVKGIHPLFDEEALRVVNNMPKWLPGMMNGEPTRVKYTVPITFRLE